MGVLADLFQNINYEELEHQFSTLDGLLEEIIPYTPEWVFDSPERFDDTVYHSIRTELKRIDDIIRNNRKIAARYHETIRSINANISQSFNPRKVDEEEDYYKRSELYEAFDEWVRNLEVPDNFFYMMYIHQRMRQMRYLVGLYGTDTREIKTLRHAFEAGLKYLRVEQGIYLRLVYGIPYNYNWKNSSHLFDGACFLLQQDFSIYFNKPIIDWITNGRLINTTRNELCKRLKYAELAYLNHRRKGFRLERLLPYKLHFNKYGGTNLEGRFRLQGNMNGYIASRDDNTIVLGLSGTEPSSGKNWKTNVCQYFGKLDPVYVQAYAILRGLWCGKSHRNGFKQSRIEVCGHSLGGGLMQFAVGAMGKADITGYGYNSAGISYENLQYVQFKNVKILHLYLPCDMVFRLPVTAQLGKSVKCTGFIPEVILAHMISSMRRYIGSNRYDIALLKGE